MAYIENLITIEQQVSNHLLLFHLLSCKYQCKELYLQKKGRIPLTCTTNMLFERLHQWHQYLFLQLFSINSGVHLISFDLK